MFINYNCAFRFAPSLSSDFIPLDSSDTSVCVETDKPNVILAAEKLKEEFEGLLLSVHDALNGVDTSKLKLHLN